MPGSICLHLVIVLSLFLSGVTELLAKEEVIIVYPGVMKTIPGPKKPRATRRKNPRVGTRKTETRLSGVTIERKAAKSDKKGAGKSTRKSARSEPREEDNERPEEVETVDVETKQNRIEILAKDGAAGQLFKLTALLTIRTSQYKKISRDQLGKKLQRPYPTWMNLPDRELKQEFTLAVALGAVPHALVPTGKEITITLPEALRRLAFTRKKRTQVEVQLEAGNRLRILGKRPGVTEFEFRYELAGKKLKATLPVRVIKKENIVSIVVEEDRKDEVGFDEIDEMFGLDNGRVLRVDSVEDPSVAQIVFDAYRVQVKGLKAGKTRALLAYTGVASGKGRRRLRCQTQVPLIITVK